MLSDEQNVQTLLACLVGAFQFNPGKAPRHPNTLPWVMLVWPTIPNVVLIVVCLLKPKKTHTA